MVTKDEAKNFTTKDDLSNLEKRLHAKIKYDIDNAIVQIGEIVDNRKADKTYIEDIEKRVTKIERKLTV
jgi:hypothetical protein